MKEKLNSHKVGLTLATFMAAGHILWSLLLATGMAAPIVDWMLSLHSVNLSYSLNAFNLTNAVVLVVVAAFKGYVIGYLFGYVWNWMMKNRL